jgi:MOSC domain-containing protein YiiM
MEMAAVVRSLQVGKAATYRRHDEDAATQWQSGIAKDEFVDVLTMQPGGVDGDVQVDLEHHGGVDKAVLIYAASHYPTWQDTLGELPFGAFGENVTVDGIDEWMVCIGDQFRLGTALVECTQPRQPCWKLSQRWQRPTLAKEVQDNGRTGWYVRVLEPGSVSLGGSMELVDRPNPSFSVAQASDVMHRNIGGLDAARALSELPQLSASWRTTMQGRLLGTDPNIATRLQGS